MPSTVPAIESSVDKTQAWLQDLAEQGGYEDEAQAYTALRAVLHSVRDRLSVDEAVHLGAQLPMVVRGCYYEGWRPVLAPTRERTEDEFYDSVAENLRSNPVIAPVRAVSSVLSFLNDKLDSGELADVRQGLPKHLNRLWPEPDHRVGAQNPVSRGDDPRTDPR